ncbi:MAG: Ig-like domain-containing protein [Anaerolineales bacterium]|nr:Ig-like domain-containing protein [Anaerolineales bacterium]
MKSWRPFERAVAFSALLLVGAIALVLWRGDHVGARVLRSSPAPGSQVAARAPVVIEFAQAMDTASVESGFSIQPATPGEFIWEGDTLRFIPRTPWQIGAEYQVQLAAGVRDQRGQRLLRPVELAFSVRTPGVAFLRLADSGYTLWAASALDAAARQLSPGDGVFDFTVTPDGEQLIFSVVNDQAGIDLWIVGRGGGDARRLLDCGADRCFAPDVAPNDQIAYNRVLAPLSPAEPYGPPRIWLLNLRSGENLRLHADTQKIGYGPHWSPDGRWLAYYDGVAGRIVILNSSSGEELALPSQAGEVGSWAPEAEYMLFADMRRAGEQVRSQIFRASLATQDILPFFDPQPEDAEFSGPVVSPDGQWVAMKMRAQNLTAEQLWVLPPDGSFAMVAVEEAGYLYSRYQWGSDSQALLYHRLQLGRADSQPSVWLWERATSSQRLLVTEASQPLWLP